MSNTNENTKVTERYQNGDYLANNSNWHVEDSSWKANQIHIIISRNNLHFSNICEVGCGAGEILRQLSSNGQRITADFSRTLWHHALRLLTYA